MENVEVVQGVKPVDRRSPSQFKLNVLWAAAIAVSGFLGMSYATQRDLTLASHETRLQAVERSQSRQEAQNEEILRRQSRLEAQNEEILRRLSAFEGRQARP